MERGHRQSAATAYLRAANYYRASLIHFSLPTRASKTSAGAARNLAFELSGYPATPVDIPHEAPRCRAT